jgi:hypothetical protein
MISPEKLAWRRMGVLWTFFSFFFLFTYPWCVFVSVPIVVYCAYRYDMEPW